MQVGVIAARWPSSISCTATDLMMRARSLFAALLDCLFLCLLRPSRIGIREGSSDFVFFFAIAVSGGLSHG